ncbi:MAG: DinB family protein [Candidatus Bathyarchaeia archaeon]
MSEKIEMMKAFAELGFSRLGRATKDLTEEQLDWKSCPEANTIRWNLTHLVSEMFVFVPKIVRGDKEYKPEGWPDDYVGNESYSLEKIMGEIEKGKDELLKKLDNLTEEVLSEEMDWFYGRRPKQTYMRLAISEILHHEGQIAAILGVEKRMQGT